MFSIKSATIFLCVAIVLINLNQYDTKTVEKVSVKASMHMDKATKMTNTTNSSLVNRFMDLDGIMHSFFPSFNTGAGSPFGNFLGYPNNGYQVNNPQYPGNDDFNNFNGGNYPVSPHIPQGNNPKYPGNGYNNLNAGTYPVNPNVPEVNNNQQYPGNGFNNNLNGANYPINYPNIPQGNNPQYPGNSFDNLNGGTYSVNPNIPRNSNNQQYPGNDYNNLNGGNYPVNPTIPQVKYPQYPEAGSNLDNSNNWNNNGYPGNYQSHPSYPNEQGQYPGLGNGWDSPNGLQNNQNPNIIVFPEDQVPIQQGHPPVLNQGNTGLQNGGSFNPQDINNNLPSGTLRRPLLQYPQTNIPGITTSTTEKVAILGLPVIVSNEFTRKPLVTLTTSTSSVMKQCVQDCPSTTEYNPVCGSNNITYFNKGKMECARYCGIDVTVQRVGACTIRSTPGIFS